MYEETEQALRHQTLTMDKQKYRGSLTPDPLEVKSGGGACKRACLVLLVFVLCVAVLVALVAGVLSLVIIFTDFINICKCTVGQYVALGHSTQPCAPAGHCAVL